MKNVVTAYFSPTGRTRDVICQMALGACGGAGREIDLSAPVEAETLGENSLLLAAVPVYGGRAPAVALERLAALRGEGAPAVAVAVYGNRAYEDALLELKTALEAGGFRAVAAAAFVAEHSIVRSVAAGRPDEADKKAAVAFGAKVAEKVERGDLEPVRVPGNPVYKDFKGLPFHPTAGKACIACGLCAKTCPTGAIPAERPNETDGERCISCMRCVMLCPVETRAIPAPAMLATKGLLAAAAKGRREPEVFL